MNKTANITGQDGAYLFKLLLDEGYRVYGTFSCTRFANFWPIGKLGIETTPICI